MPQRSQVKKMIRQMQVSDAPLQGDRLTVVQELWGMSQSELSKKLEITQSHFSKIAKRQRALTPEIVTRACQQFDLPYSFFTAVTPRECSGVVTFRRGSKTSAKQRDRVTRLLREATRAWLATSEESQYKTVSLPDANLSTQEAAQWVRHEDGLSPQAPIKNTVRLLERLGIGVITQLDQQRKALESVSKMHSGASIPASQNVRPLIALVNPLPGAVARLTLAHELGHLIYDKDRPHQIEGIRAPEEQRAFDFAMRLLVPHDYLEDQVSETTPLRSFLPIKAKYGVSVRALITHAKKSQLITPARQRSLHIQMSSLGWNKGEPVEVAAERPILFAQAANQIWPENTVENMAYDLGLSRNLVALWIGEERKESAGATILNLDEYREMASRR